MELLNELKALVPDYAKDVRLNLDATITRSSLAPADALGVALAAAYAARAPRIVAAIRGSGALPEQDTAAALSAAALMGMNNVWYPYVSMSGDADLKALPAQLRMQAYATHGGVDSKWVYELTPTADGTRFDLSVEYEIPLPVLGKLAEKLVAKANEREVEVAMQNAKDQCEAGAVRPIGEPTSAAAELSH